MQQYVPYDLDTLFRSTERCKLQKQFISKKLIIRTKLGTWNSLSISTAKQEFSSYALGIRSLITCISEFMSLSAWNRRLYFDFSSSLSKCSL